MTDGIVFFIVVCTCVTYEISKLMMFVGLYLIDKMASFRTWRDTKQRDFMFYGVSMLVGCSLYPLMDSLYGYFENLNYFVAFLPGFVMFLGILRAVMQVESKLLRRDATVVYLDRGNGEFEKAICS